MFRLAILIFSVVALLPSMAYAQAYEREPLVTLDSAVKRGREYVQDKQLDISKSYLDSVVLEQNNSGDRGKFWLLTWQEKRFVKGGQLYVRVYMNGQVEHGFGE